MKMTSSGVLDADGREPLEAMREIVQGVKGESEQQARVPFAGEALRRTRRGGDRRPRLVWRHRDVGGGRRKGLYAIPCADCGVGRKRMNIFSWVNGFSRSAAIASRCAGPVCPVAKARISAVLRHSENVPTRRGGRAKPVDATSAGSLIARPAAGALVRMNGTTRPNRVRPRVRTATGCPSIS